MRPITIELTSPGNKAVVLDYLQENFNVGFGVTVTGVVDFSVQHTFDDPYAKYATNWATNATWFEYGGSGLTNATASDDGNYLFPARGTRLVLNSGAGSVKMTILQGRS